MPRADLRFPRFILFKRYTRLIDSATTGDAFWLALRSTAMSEAGYTAEEMGKVVLNKVRGKVIAIVKLNTVASMMEAFAEFFPMGVVKKFDLNLHLAASVCVQVNEVAAIVNCGSFYFCAETVDTLTTALKHAGDSELHQITSSLSAFPLGRSLVSGAQARSGS